MQSFMPIHFFVFKTRTIENGFAYPKRFQDFRETGPRPVNRGTHERMSKGYLQPLVFFIFGVTFVHANLCMHILASTCQDGGNPFLAIRLPVVNSVTDSSRHTLLLPALHSQWSRQVYIIHQSITGFLVVQEPTCTHAHEYRLLGASCCGIH